MEGALDAQSLISLSLRKIHSSRSQRGGIKLHKNLLVSYVLRNARQLYLSQRYAELCRRQQQQHPQLHYQPFPGAPTAGNDFHIPDDEGDASDDYPPPHPHHQLRSCSLLGRSSEAMEDLPAPSGMRGEALAPFYPHRPLPPGSPLPPPPPYDFSSLHAQPPPLPSGHGSPTPAFPPPPPPPCPSRTTVLDLDTHVVTTVDNGYLHQDCGCAQCPPVGAGTHPAAPPPPLPPPPSPLSLLQTKRRYVQDVSIPPNGPERGAVEVVLGAPFPFKRKYDDPDSSTGDPPRDHITPPTRDPCPKRARLEDFSEPQSSSSNISNLISIFGSGFTGLVGRQQQQQQVLLQQQQQPPSPSAQQVWHQQVPQASSCSTATAAAAQPIDPEQQQQHLNGQLCSKQALASLGAWTRAIVAF
ncbi:immediate early response gene 5-like protein [Sceloporus undulatus]|uniref:immediate early response gene 5-like protein n=1 Tax=Sceloporus undulatus TaxID=8520 RepID=UPI001C4D0EDC|nr:immediate early response gene 5-like protein [Sceloporus undulatus]